MNYGVYGFIKDKDCNPIVGAKIYPYFKKVDSGSPDSKWSDEFYTSDSQGYYGFDLSDDVLLGSEQGFKKGTDRVYIAVSNNGDLNSLDFDSCLFIDHTTINEDLFELNLNIEDKRPPIFQNYTFPDATLTQHTYTMSEDSYEDTSWKNDGCYDTSISQKYLYDNVSIFQGHKLIDTIYGWGEKDDVSILNNTSDNYRFINAGVYLLTITIREAWNTEATVTKEVTIKYNEPEMDFNWTPTQTSEGSIKGQELITFHNTTTCLDDRLNDPYTYKWEIQDENQDGSDNSKVYDNQQYVYEPQHQFQSAGLKEITLTCYWNDGFEDQQVSITKTIEIIAFDITPNFTWDIEPSNRETEVTFINTTEDVDSKQISYDMEIHDYFATFNPQNTNYSNDTTNNDATHLLNNPTDTISHYFQSKFAHEITMTVLYYNGWVNKTKIITKNLNPREHLLTLDIQTNISPQIGKMPIEYTYSTTGSATSRRLNDNWHWNDVEFETNNDIITDRLKEVVDTPQEFTWQSPSRKPYSAIDGATTENKNKLVSLEVNYDNGWEDNKYANTSKYFEATPYELESNITYETNIDRYKH